VTGTFLLLTSISFVGICDYISVEMAATVFYKKKPTCVELDGICVMDDVGGMGWTGKLPKPESLL
jgi:hypothetical protein